MAERWILNASPLIVLARVGYHNLLFDLADEVVLPRPVVNEINAGPVGDPARELLATAHIPIVETPTPPAELLAWDLGAGETAVITYALANPGWTVVLEDGVARKCANTFSIPLKGTLAIIILAKQRGLIASAATVLRALQQGGFHLSDTLAREVLSRTVGESWD